MVYRICKVIKTFNRIRKVEQGQVLPLVLIMLVLGATIVAGSLTYAATTVKIGATSKTNQIQLYSADAGVQEVIWRLKTNYEGITDALASGSQVTYDPDESNDTDINDEDLSITIKYTQPYENVGFGFWKITSTASSGGTATTVDTYLLNFSLFFDYSAVAREEIRNKGTIEPEGSWVEGWDYFPPVTLLRQYFSSGLLPSSQTTIDTGSVGNVIPFKDTRYTNGLAVTGKGTLSLESNIYIDGYLDLGNEDMNIVFNGYTIYVAGNEAIQNGTGWIDSKAKTGLFGDGCIIAEGNIVLYPKMANSDDYILLMSVTGTVNLQPQADFYGSVVAGGYDLQSISIQMQPGSVVNSSGEHEALDFPLWAMTNWQSYRTAVVTGLLDKGEEKIAYSEIISAIGKEPITWTFTGLPVWLSWDETSRTISGTPPEGSAGNYPILVEIEDAAAATASKILTLTIVPQPELYDVKLPDGQVGVWYAHDIGINFGVRPFKWSYDILPGGLELNPVTGVISGIPIKEEPYTYPRTWYVTITVEDVLGGIADPRTLPITIAPPTTP